MSSSWCLRFVRDPVVCLTLCFLLFAWSNWGFSQFCFLIATLLVKSLSWLAGDPAFGRNMLSPLSRYNSEDGGSMSLRKVDLYLPDHTLNVRRPENLTSERPHIQGTWCLAWIALTCFAQQNVSSLLSLSPPGGNISMTTINVTTMGQIIRILFPIYLLHFITEPVLVPTRLPRHFSGGGDWLVYFQFI